MMAYRELYAINCLVASDRHVKRFMSIKTNLDVLMFDPAL